MSETSYASVVRPEKLSQQRQSVADPANHVNRGYRYNPNYNEQRTVNPDKSIARPEVIGMNFELKPSDYSPKVGEKVMTLRWHDMFHRLKIIKFSFLY